MECAVRVDSNAIVGVVHPDSSLVFFHSCVQCSPSLTNVSAPTAAVYLVHYSFHFLFVRFAFYSGEEAA